MNEEFPALDQFGDWVDAAVKTRELFPLAHPGSETRDRIREIIGFSGLKAEPDNVQTERTWQKDGLSGEEISWSVGYGPRTLAWILKPGGARSPLPGIVALHGHDGVKFFGKEKIANDPSGPAKPVEDLREELYGGRAFANELAKRGFIVLVHDVFLWGSRRFPFAAMPGSIRSLVNAWDIAERQGGRIPGEADRYDAAAKQHEHVIAKYCTVLGTTLAGVVNFEDRVAIEYLRSRSDVIAGSIACIGLSGGGCRAALLQATCEQIAGAVVVGMMSTYRELLGNHIEPHTWMFFPPGLAAFADWPDLAASRAPAPLLIQYTRGDQLFPLKGMELAHERIASHYRESGKPDAYLGRFYEGSHQFSVQMQEEAFEWLRLTLGA
jgi:dienelactone hydrolase